MIRIPPLPSPPLRDAVLPAGSRAGQSRTGFSGSPRPGSPFKAAPEVQQPELQLQQVGVPRGLRPTARALSGATQRPRPDAAPRSPAAPGGGGGGAAAVAPSLRGCCGVGCWRRRSQEMAKERPRVRLPPGKGRCRDTAGGGSRAQRVVTYGAGEKALPPSWGGWGCSFGRGGGSHPYLTWNAAGAIAVPCPFGDAPFGVAAFEVAAPLGKA